MKNLIIIGAGGYGREIYNLAKQTKSYNKEYIIKGFIDDNLFALDKFRNYPKIISKINEYKIKENDIFICAISNIEIKKSIISIFKLQNAKFINLIHKSVRFHNNVKLGEGIIIADNSTISCECIIDDFVTINSSVCIGHDVIIGKFTNIYSFVFIGGNVKISSEVNIFTRATIMPKINIEIKSNIGSCSLVIKDVKSGITVFGIPAKKIF